MAIDFRARQAKNRRQTIVLLGLMGSLVAGLVWLSAWYMGYTSIGIVPIAVGIALIGVWGSYYSSDKIVLTMTRAKVVDETTAPQLINLVHEVCIASGLPTPKVAVIDDPAPNAFATGRNPEHAVIAFTSGILQKMDREQLQGVVAHELAHVANRDTLVSAVAATTAGAIALLSDLVLRMTLFGGRKSNSGSNPILLIVALVALILAPLAAILIKSAISRQREALADATAIEFTRNPAGLRRALETLAEDSTVVQQKSNAVAHLWIESPLDNSLTGKLFRTHPPLEDRIELLKKMESQQD